MKKLIISIFLGILAFSGCSGTENKQVSLRNVINEMEESANFKKSRLEDLTSGKAAKDYGINADDIKQGYVLYEDSSQKPDKIIILEAKDKTKLENIEKAITNESTGLKNTFKRNPVETKKLNKTLTKTRGNYVLMVVCENTERIKKIFDKSV